MVKLFSWIFKKKSVEVSEPGTPSFFSFFFSYSCPLIHPLSVSLSQCVVLCWTTSEDRVCGTNVTASLPPPPLPDALPYESPSFIVFPVHLLKLSLL